MDNRLRDISASMISRYTKRYSQMGYNVHTLGWGNREQQSYRFAQTYAADINGKSVLDIGCGFGDYYKAAKENGITIPQFTGWDINPALIDEANKLFANNPRAHFKVVDLTEDHTVQENVADVGIMLGLLNLNLSGTYDNIAYSKLMIRNAWKAVKCTLVVDFLSTHRTPDYPMEDFIFYHNPAEMLQFALELSPNVVIKHDYLPIPQREFMIFINKQT